MPVILPHACKVCYSTKREQQVIEYWKFPLKSYGLSPLAQLDIYIISDELFLPALVPDIY